MQSQKCRDMHLEEFSAYYLLLKCGPEFYFMVPLFKWIIKLCKQCFCHMDTLTRGELALGNSLKSMKSSRENDRQTYRY